MKHIFNALMMALIFIGPGFLSETKNVNGQNLADTASVTTGFCTSFQSNTLDAGWEWIDPLGDSSYSLSENPGSLRLKTPHGEHDFYMNHNAPRLLQTVSGDFTVETKVSFSPHYNYQAAGIFLWLNDSNFIRLERTLVDGVDGWYSVNGTYQGVSNNYSASIVFLKLARSNNQVILSYSPDGAHWTNFPSISFPATNPVKVGLHLINQWQDNPIAADFDYFKLNGCEISNHQSVFLPMVIRKPAQKTIPFLVLSYFPPSAANPDMLDAVETGISNRTISYMRKYVNQMVEQGSQYAGEGTRYHAYKDPAAEQYLGFTLFDQKEYLLPVPKGAPLTPPNFLWNFGKIMRDANVCDYVDNHGVKEIWIYGYESAVMHPSESKMSSRYGDISNSYRDEYLPAEFRMPKCINAYTAYGFNYAREIETELEDRMHQIETMMGYIDDALFWEDFADRYDAAYPHNFRSSCGDAHLTPNWLDPRTDVYIYNLTNFAESNCETWNPDESKTTYISLNCQRWGCTKLGFFTWFMQSIPGYQNGITYNGKQMRNWWDVVYDFNAYMDKGRTFYEP